MCIGKDFWHSSACESLGISSMLLTDGPHGIRKQEGSAEKDELGESEKSICFPAGCATACSFNPSVSLQIGKELGKQAITQGVDVVLGPAINIKRSPLCGRNFEYFSEDPLLSGKMAVGEITGIQEQGVGSCVKHFALNNQEYFRQTSNSVVDEKTLREIYLPSFEMAVKQAKPWAIMSAYNRVNGVYASENKVLLTDILKNEWGFKGAVITDWGACNNPVDGILAGMNLCMPGPIEDYVQQIMDAVNNGILEESVLNDSVMKIIEMVLKSQQSQKTEIYDFENGHAIAAWAEEESAVLLKNDENILPLKDGESVLFIGSFAKNPRYQGGGSSHINAWKVESVLQEIKMKQGVEYLDINMEKESVVLTNQMSQIIKNADKIVVFAGLPDAYETEAVDRKTLDLPEGQNKLIEMIASWNENVIVVLHNGSPVSMPWLAHVKGILELYLGGEAVGKATSRILYGEVNPSGRLAETFPLKIEDTPTYPYYGEEKEDVIYREGSLIGYRYYETKKSNVLFPFGYGLSYTDFSYSNLKIDKEKIREDEMVHVSVDVTNYGLCDGKEVVQLYVSPCVKGYARPCRELKAFDKIFLKQAETKTVTFELDKRAFAYWDCTMHDWYVPEGEYIIQVAKSSTDIILEKKVYMIPKNPIKPVFTMNSPLQDALIYEQTRNILLAEMQQIFGNKARQIDEKNHSQEQSGTLSQEAMQASATAMPIRALASFGRNVKIKDLEKLVVKLNQAIK